MVFLEFSLVLGAWQLLSSEGEIARLLHDLLRPRPKIHRPLE